MVKKCNKCKTVKEIHLYYENKELADGFFNECKACVKKRVTERYRDPLKKEQIIAYEKKRQQDPQRRAKKLLYQARMRAKHPGRYKARNKVNNAVRDGRLEKKPCMVCGSEKVEAHHKDYRKYLEVTWLCREHHLETEGKQTY